jgi:hypothetical protein
MRNEPDRQNDSRDEGRATVPPRRWTVLFIGDHGKVISFKRVKLLIGLGICVLVMSLAAVAILVVVDHQLQRRVRDLQQRLEASHQKNQALREEKDLLTAHVVLAEAKMKEILAGASRSSPERRTIPVAGTGKPEKDAAGELAQAEAAADPAPPAKGFNPPAGSGETIAVEGVRIKLDADRQTIHFQYKLVNTGPGRKPSTGHVILVFKGDDIDPEQWLKMPPWIDLPRGRPSGMQKGYAFSINHSKAFSQSMPVPKAFPGFTTAILYVFSKEGQLLLAQDFAVDIHPSGS